MKKPTKSTVAAAVTAGGLFLATGAGALTLPGQASDEAVDAVKTAVPSSVVVTAGAAAADARQDADHRQDEAKDEDTTTESPAAEDETDDAGDAAADTHGAVVSEFARTTELEGREKGQAIADLAKQNAGDDDEADTDDDGAKPAVTGADRAAQAKAGHGDDTDD
jgi:hypothetical protein